MLSSKENTRYNTPIRNVGSKVTLNLNMREPLFDATWKYEYHQWNALNTTVRYPGVKVSSLESLQLWREVTFLRRSVLWFRLLRLCECRGIQTCTQQRRRTASFLNQRLCNFSITHSCERLCFNSRMKTVKYCLLKANILNIKSHFFPYFHVFTFQRVKNRHAQKETWFSFPAIPHFTTYMLVALA